MADILLSERLWLLHQRSRQSKDNNFGLQNLHASFDVSSNLFLLCSPQGSWLRKSCAVSVALLCLTTVSLSGIRLSFLLIWMSGPSSETEMKGEFLKGKL